MINKELIIQSNTSLLEALSIMDRIMRKLLIICEDGKFVGVLSIGDIQRAILKKQDLSKPAIEAVREKITFANKGEDIQLIKKKMRERKIECMPIVDENGFLFDTIEWDELFNKPEKSKKVDFPVVIMAGGKGTRLLPLTNVIPKPLIPISDKTIIEEIMYRFKNVGSERFYISLNYLTEIVQDYFSQKDWNIKFIQEKKPLGTAGSLYLIKKEIDTTFFVTNCDTLVDINIGDLINYHKKNNNIITIVTAVKTIHIPYGTIETGIDGVVESIREKPDYIYQFNSGLYVMEPSVFDYIENEQELNVPDLIISLIKDGKRVGAFPVSEKSWIDMGNWDEYLTLVRKYLDKE